MNDFIRDPTFPLSPTHLKLLLVLAVVSSERDESTALVSARDDSNQLSYFANTVGTSSIVYPFNKQHAKWALWTNLQLGKQSSYALI